MIRQSELMAQKTSIVLYATFFDKKSSRFALDVSVLIISAVLTTNQTGHWPGLRAPLGPSWISLVLNFCLTYIFIFIYFLKLRFNRKL